MNRQPRWERAVSHRGDKAVEFISEYLGLADRRVLFIGGAGFDPRATAICRILAEAARGRTRGFFIREEHPRSDPRLLERAESNIEVLRGLVAEYVHHHLPIISDDGAVIGGHYVGSCVREHCDFAGVTDVVDVSALSKGISFPLIRGLLEDTIIPDAGPSSRPNIHVMVLNECRTDAEIVGEASDRAEVIQGFQGILDHDEAGSAARL
jgi:hypothetical protein